MDINLLKSLLKIHSPSGNEAEMTEFILKWLQNNQSNFKVKPEIYSGEGFQDCIIVVFGKPRTAIFAHMDTVGFMVRYGKELVEIGSPEAQSGFPLAGIDSAGEIEAELLVEENMHYYQYSREIESGTELVFNAPVITDGDVLKSPYLDNRVGLFNALNQCFTLENGAIAFSCWEENHGGSSGYLMKFLFEKFGVTQTLISDITWVTHGILLGNGPVVSLRDVGIPRRSFVKKIKEILQKKNIGYQLEVESFGSSDGYEIQRSPYPVDWCFIGIACENMHSPNETISIKDLQAMIRLYEVLLSEL